MKISDIQNIRFVTENDSSWQIGVNSVGETFILIKAVLADRDAGQLGLDFDGYSITISIEKDIQYEEMAEECLKCSTQQEVLDIFAKYLPRIGV